MAWHTYQPIGSADSKPNPLRHPTGRVRSDSDVPQGFGAEPDLRPQGVSDGVFDVGRCLLGMPDKHPRIDLDLHLNLGRFVCGYSLS